MALLIAFAAIVTACWLFVLPVVLQTRIDDWLRTYEPTHRHFRLNSIGLTEMSITDVELGSQPWLSVHRVNVRYDLKSLRQGRVLDVEIIEPTWRIERHDGEMGWGFSTGARQHTAGSLDLPMDALAVRDGRIVFDNEGFEMQAGITISAARNSNAGSLAGRVETTAIEVRGGASLAPITGSFDIHDQNMNFDASWMATADAQVTAKADVHVTKSAISGLVQVRVPPLSLGDAQPLLSLVPQLRAIEMGGQVNAAATINIENGVAQSSVRLYATDVRMASHHWPIAINSAWATVLFDSLSPLRTQGRQFLNIGSATTGELEIRDAAVEFEIESKDAIAVHDATWTIVDGGSFRASPFRFDPRTPVVVTTIDCEGVDLHRWLTLITDGRADGDGMLAGRFSIAWDPRVYPRLRFLDGSLIAQDKPGWIKTSDSASLLNLLDEANPDFAIDSRLAEVKAKIVDALGDFGYTSLHLNFVPDGADVILQAELKGKGRRGAKPVEFESLTINLHNFAATLQDVLDLQSALDKWER